ncbi:Peroxisome chaperone and import receptor [Lecanora helva]
MDKVGHHGSAPEEQGDSALLTALATPDDVPDPDEDDLDDLDDMLDQFSATKVSTTKSSPANPTYLSEKSSDGLANDFNKQLQDQMAALMGNEDESPGMKREIEAMMQDLGVAADPTPSADGPVLKERRADGKGQPPNTEEPFQETIKKTMERMQASGEQATAAAKSEESDDMLAQMFKEMQKGGLEGGANDEGLNKMLMGIMEQLTNKDILYEPMKELHNKFPAWMMRNQDSTASDDLKRYKEQQLLVAEIVGRFEQKGYSDSKVGDREFIVDRMQRMQAAGSPPADLVGNMDAAQDALGDIDSGCAQQ